MMKSYATICLNLWMVCAFMLAGESARIEEVQTFSNKSKSSVVIYYSGAERLRFFAIDSAENLFTLDFPGVYSDFDFSALRFDQAREVRQETLDPDSSMGLSVRFFLVPGATYQVFDQGKGELTILFESPEEEPAMVAEAAAPVAAPPENFTEQAGYFQEITGRSGEGRFSKLSIVAGDQEGRMLLQVADLDKYKTFSLREPERFVVDLYDTVLSLESNDVLLDLPLVRNVRIRQFQSNPTPITRMVLDLAETPNFNVVPFNDGLLIAFADEPARLTSLMMRMDGQNSEDQSLVAMDKPADPVPVITTATPTETVTEEPAALYETPEPMVDTPEEQVAQSEEQPEPASSPIEDNPVEGASDPGEDQMVTVAEETAPTLEGSVVEPAGDAEQEKSEIAYQPEESESTIADRVEPEMEQAPELVTLDNEPVEERTDDAGPIEDITDDTELIEAEETITTAETDSPSAEAIEPADDQGMIAGTDQTPAAEPASEDMADQVEQVTTEPELVTLPVAENREEPAPESEPAEIATAPEETPGKEIAAVVEETPRETETPVATTPRESSSQRVDAELEAFTEPMEEETIDREKPTVSDFDVVENVNEGPKPVIDDIPGEDPDFDTDFAMEPEEAKPSFVMASDIDMEMGDFLQETPREETLYTMMKGVRSNRKVPDRVIVTNEAIEENKRLGEMRAMQEESGDEDFSMLFDDSSSVTDGAGTVETLDTGEKQYHGFEISIIDVKDADVVDLLRFIAHQVGINLYVDSSVSNLRATYRFRNIPWDQALDIILANANLDKQFLNGVLRVATTQKFQEEAEARRRLERERELNVPTETVTFSLNYADAEEALGLVEEYLSPRGTVLMDERTNMLIIEDIPRRMTTIRALIKKIDRVVAQVSIEARLVETTKRFLKELGIQWGLSAQYSPENGTETGVDFPNRLGVGGPVIGSQSPGGLLGGYAINMPVVGENPSGVGLTLGNFLDNFKLDISLQMLETEGFGQIISSPKVTTQNNATAIIKNGQRIPIQTINRGIVTTTYVEAVLQLEVTPHITADETVIMDLIVDKSEVDFTRTVFGNPVINIRKAETKVLVKNGGTAVIGGIFTLNEQGSEDGIPKLRNIPLLKRLFSHELYSYENQELLIFVTPRIVKY